MPTRPAQSSRALLQPGPQPPLSHLGVTLLRHVVTTGLRYALHQLGAPIPEGAPARIVRLRLYLDRPKLEQALAGAPAAEALVGALLEPGGRGELPADAAALRGALRFHRPRLRLFPRRLPAIRSAPREATAEASWAAFRATLTQALPALNDALLGELVAALDRRATRARGERLEHCLGPQAHAARMGRAADLTRLGILDPLTASWSASPGALEHLRERLDALPDASRHRLRGNFRESYRRALEPLRARFLELAEAASASGLLEQPGDAFFLPFDLAEDLTSPRPLDWLLETVSSNRREYQSLVDAQSPAETVGAGPPRETVDDRRDWGLAPLWPLE